MGQYAEADRLGAFVPVECAGDGDAGQPMEFNNSSDVKPSNIVEPARPRLANMLGTQSAQPSSRKRHSKSTHDNVGGPDPYKDHAELNFNDLRDLASRKAADAVTSLTSGGRRGQSPPSEVKAQGTQELQEKTNKPESPEQQPQRRPGKVVGKPEF